MLKSLLLPCKSHLWSHGRLPCPCFFPPWSHVGRTGRGVCGQGLEAPRGALQMGAWEMLRSGPQTPWVTLSPGAPGHRESHLVGLGWVPGDSEGCTPWAALGLRKCTCWAWGQLHPPVWMLFKSRPPRLLFSELVTLVTVTGKDVTLAPRGPFITSFYVNQPFTQGGGSPACLGFKTSGRLGVGERKPYT